MDSEACPLCPRVILSFLSSALATPPKRQAGLAPNTFPEMRKARLSREADSHPEAVVDQKDAAGSVWTPPQTELGLDPSSSTPSSKRMKRTLNTSLTSFCILKAASLQEAVRIGSVVRGPSTECGPRWAVSQFALFFFSKGRLHRLIFPLQKTLDGRVSCGSKYEEVTGGLSHPSPSPPLSSSHSRSLQPPVMHTPAGSLPWLIPLLWCTLLFPLSQVSSQLIFQATLCITCSKKPSLASLAICWSTCGGPVSVRFFDDCLLCHQALSSLRADTLHGLSTAPLWPPAQPLAGTWWFPDF